MSDPLGLSIGTTNLVAVRVGNQPVTHRAAVTLGDGSVLDGFVERVGDPVPLVAPDGSTHRAEQLLVQALGNMVRATGGQPSSDVAVAVPAHWGMATLRSLRNALRADPNLSPNGMPARLVSDAITALTALQTNPGLPARGVIALLDFGGGGTSITLADAAASFEPIDETTRYTDFAGDQIDQALLSHIVNGIAEKGGIDPAATAAVGSLSRLRDECRNAKERLSTDATTEIAAELPNHRSTIRLTRDELESLIAAPLDSMLAELENTLERNGIGWPDIAAVVAVGGGASIPLIAQRLSQLVDAQVIRTPQPALDAAVGAALFATYGSAAQAQTGMAPMITDAPTGLAPAASSMDAPSTETANALAWSQDDDIGDEPVPYTGENRYESPYDSDALSMRQPVQYVPSTGPIEKPRTWHRLPQLVIGLAAAIALIAVGGVAIALTSVTDSGSKTDPPSTASPPKPTNAEPPPPATAEPPASVAPPPPETATVAPESPPQTQETVTTYVTTTAPTTTTPPTTTTTTTMTTTTTTTTTTTSPTTTTTTTTTPAMTTTHITVPFVPVPIPIQVPNNGFQPPAP